MIMIGHAGIIILSSYSRKLIRKYRPKMTATVLKPTKFIIYSVWFDDGQGGFPPQLASIQKSFCVLC